MPFGKKRHLIRGFLFDERCGCAADIAAETAAETAAPRRDSGVVVVVDEGDDCSADDEIVDEDVGAVEAVGVVCGRLDGCREVNVESVDVVEVCWLSAAPRRR